jgi:hypothetical protein
MFGGSVAGGMVVGRDAKGRNTICKILTEVYENWPTTAVNAFDSGTVW